MRRPQGSRVTSGLASATRSTPARSRPRVIILGAGFGGLSAARTLGRAPVDITLIDRTNHHVFQPLLYQVATAVLAPSDITHPIRHLMRKQANTRVWLADVHSIDPDRRVVVVDDDRREISYDFLIVATGSRHSYFDRPEWEALAPGLKTIADARLMRQRFLTMFEEAEKCDDPAVRATYLTFVVVGAGPTGVELAGMLPEITRHAMSGEFRTIDPGRARVVLLEGGPRVLPTFPPHLSARAQRDLESLGVEVRTNARVTRVTREGVEFGGERIATRAVFWAAGNVASPLGRSLGAPLDRMGRVLVEADLSVPGHPEIFVIGDLAAVRADDGEWVPALAPAATQAGRVAADNIVRTLEGRSRVPFRYRDKGSLATIGRHRAIARFGRITLSGRFAWLLWLFVHILYLVGFRNRASVLVEWAYAYFTYQRGARLITD